MAAPSPVGMIGLGLMGTALAARLRDAGIPVIGFDIDRAKCTSFGGDAAASVEEVISRCRTVVLAVLNAEKVEARRTKQHLAMTLVQTDLLRAAINLAGLDADSAAIIEAIRPSRAASGAST